MPTLNSTVPLIKMHRIARLVRHDLNLDMPRLNNKLFQIHLSVIKRSLSLSLRRGKSTVQTDIVVSHPHPATATARGCLDYHRIPDLVGDLNRLSLVLDLTGRARNHGNAGLPGHLPGGNLIAQQPHRLSRRTDEHDPALLADLGKVSVLSKKTITRMDRFNVGDLSGADYPRNIQIALGSIGGTYTYRLVS